VFVNPSTDSLSWSSLFSFILLHFPNPTHRCESAMTIDIQPEEEDAVVRVAATPEFMGYMPHEARMPPHEHLPGGGDIVQHFLTRPVSSLGALSHLPVELVSAIFLNADISTLFRLRQVSRLARMVVSNLWQYRDIATHAANALQVVLRTGVATHFTIVDLHNSLCAPECQACGCFGALLYLPNLRRCCCDCPETRSCESPELVVAVLASGTSNDPSSQPRAHPRLPVVRILPGINHWEDFPIPEQWRELVNKSALMALCPSWSELVIPDPASHSQLDLDDNQWKFFTATTPFPYLNRVTGQVETGLDCYGCRCVLIDMDDKLFDQGLLHPGDFVYPPKGPYTKKDFLKHFQVCPAAQELWRQSHGGTILP
jgi:hypothetical protein